MCASYLIHRHHAGRYGVPVETRVDIGNFYDRVIVPYTPAPVVIGQQVQIMNFALLPNWSKEPKVKFATHNARLEGIEEKPTWKNVFIERHCLVPLSEFIEPIYEGEFAGNMVAFSEHNGEELLAAGVWDEWVNRKTGEVIHSFAIITHEPPPFVANTGHDRCPIFLNLEAGEEWLSNQNATATELKRFLLTRNTVPEFSVAKHRPMKPGWEKRR